MSELILTQEEKDAMDWLSLPDKTIADVTRHMGVIFKKVNTEHSISVHNRPLLNSAAMHLCVEHALEYYDEVNVDKVSIDFTDLSYRGKVMGNWKLTIEKINEDE